MYHRVNTPLSYLQWRILRFMSKAGAIVYTGEKREERCFAIEDGCFAGFQPCRGNRDLLAAVGPAAKALVGTAYIEEFYNTHTSYSPSERRMIECRYGPYYRLTKAGRKAALGPAPAWELPKPPALGALEHEVLGALAWHPSEWRRPLDCGGNNGSGHSAALFNLVLNGYAEISKNHDKPVSGAKAYPEPHLFRRGKGSRRFRITAAGVEYHQSRRQAQGKRPSAEAGPVT